MKYQYLIGAACAALMIPGAAFAQSTGTISAEEDIVVTGANSSKDGVQGVVIPDAAKAKAVLTQEIISRGTAGNTILNSINLIPGVNFTNSDAYGSSGGNIRIRGFDGNRVSLTFDGFPLNDSGNYAIYSNQQLDPELIEQVNVNLGTTDVDSPTAAASGGTINYRTRMPGEKLGGIVSASIGENDYQRIFGMLDTGVLTSFGTRAFISASTARNDKFKGPGKIEKQQFNARIYQPIGDNGDFVSIAGHYNKNRNNFYRNPGVNDLRGTVLPGVIPPNTAISAANPLVLDFNKAQQDLVFNFDNDALCATPVTGCSNFYKMRINPSNTGNVRINSRFSLAENLVLTLDGAYSYTLAHGGSSPQVLGENDARVRGQAGKGVDFNGDGDTSDRIGFFAPNITNTRRYTFIGSLIWDIAPEHRLRVSYTFDRARHRQTGEFGFLDSTGAPENWFSGRNGRPVLAADGFQLQQRDRLSVALLNQVSAQYIGKFFDEKLRVEIGVRAPFFKRDLNNYCYTQYSNGFAYCTSETIAPGRILAPGALPANDDAAKTALYAPFTAKYKFNKVLPSAGLTFNFGGGVSAFASYTKGLSAPRTDQLYRAPIIDITPETTDAFDLGARYTTNKIQAQLTGWYIGYKNRIVTSFDQDQGISLDRNVGKVTSYGFDASLGYQVAKPLFLYVFGSYIHSELKDNIQLGVNPNGTPILAPTKGKRVAETPNWSFGGRAQVALGPVEIGGQVKYVGSRFATDVNDVKVPSYTLVDLDARLSLAQWGLEKTYFQVNVSNLFDKFYFGNISTQIDVTGNPNFSIGAPRTVLGTLVVGF